MINPMVQQTYQEWLDLLKRTKNEDLLKDPYNIWIEAFHVGTILAQNPKGLAPYILDKPDQGLKPTRLQLVRKDEE